MMVPTTSKKLALISGLCLAMVGTAASSAMAMPMGGDHFMNSTSLLQHTAVGQHRIYPGSNSEEAKKARADRNAPNMFCEKQQQRCE